MAEMQRFLLPSYFPTHQYMHLLDQQLPNLPYPMQPIRHFQQLLLRHWNLHHYRANRIHLDQNLAEPQFVNLMHDNKQMLVVRRLLRLNRQHPLILQQLINLQIFPIRHSALQPIRAQRLVVLCRIAVDLAHCITAHHLRFRSLEARTTRQTH